MKPTITIAAYFMGRDKSHAQFLTADMQTEAARTVTRANLLIEAMPHWIDFETSPRTGTVVSSGWRPPDINAGTPGAAVKSKHLTCKAIDVYDPDGDIDEWCISPEGQSAMEVVGLWLEHPSATKGWSHWQTVPPGSGRRTFYP
jgi:hypothetical protein